MSFGDFSLGGVQQGFARLTGRRTQILENVVILLGVAFRLTQGKTSTIDVAEFTSIAQILGQGQEVTTSFGHLGLDALLHVSVIDIGRRLRKSHTQFPIAIIQVDITNTTRAGTKVNDEGSIDSVRTLLGLPISTTIVGSGIV